MRVGHEKETKGVSKYPDSGISTSWRLRGRRQGLVPALKWECMARPGLSSVSARSEYVSTHTRRPEKIAACRVKLFELVERDEESASSKTGKNV